MAPSRRGAPFWCLLSRSHPREVGQGGVRERERRESEGRTGGSAAAQSALKGGMTNFVRHVTRTVSPPARVWSRILGAMLRLKP